MSELPAIAEPAAEIARAGFLLWSEGERDGGEEAVLVASLR